MSIQSVRASFTSTYQSFSAYMTVRQQKVATVALLVIGCLVTFFAYYWYCLDPKKRNVQVNNANNNGGNNGIDAQVNHILYREQLAKANKQKQEINDLVAERRRAELQFDQFMNKPIEHHLNNPVVTPEPAPALIPRPVAPTPALNTVPPPVVVAPPVYVAPLQMAFVPVLRENFATLPELLDHVDTMISYLSDLEKSMNQRGVATDHVGLAGIIANYNTQIKPTLVHPIDGANDAQRLKWKDTLHAFNEAKENLIDSIRVDNFKIVFDKDLNERQLMINFAKARNPLYHCLAEGYYLAGCYKEVIEMVSKITDDQKFKEKLFISIADYYYQQGELKEAVNVLGKICEDKAGREKGYIKIAEAYCQQDQIEEAVNILRLKINDDKAGREKIYIKIAWVYYQKNQLKDAFNVLDKIYDDKKAKDECLVQMAEDCYKNGNRKEARNTIDKTCLDYNTKQALLKKYA